MNTLLRFKIVLLSLFLMLSACSDDFWFDFLLGPQPNFIEDNDFTPGLSILGIIRPDSIENRSLSYVLVEKLIAAVNTNPDSFNVIDAKVMVYHIVDEEKIDSFEFVFDTTQFFPSIYRPVDFQPQAGNSYSISCTWEGLPEVTAETTVPEVPEIVDDAITINGSCVQFSILSHPLAAMYDIYLFSGNFPSIKRVLKATNGNTYIEIMANEEIESGSFIIIYAYDANLSSYLTAPNIFIKPNTYRQPFSMVKGGYGCFGSMNFLVRDIY